eukprot:10938870-Lingulodinium_polyedra.AAC.1
MHQFIRVLSPGVSKAEKGVARLVAKINRLARKAPEKASGPSNWFSMVLQQLRAKPGEEPQEARSFEQTKQTCIRVAAHWCQLAAHEQAWHYAIALAKAEGRHQQNEEEMKALVEQHKALMQEVEDEKAKLPPLMMSACNLDVELLDLFERLCTDA